MTASLTASAAILKTRYPEGRLPKANYRNFKHTSQLTKHEDFSGENKVIAIQTENPQGSSADYQVALGSLEQGTYKKFTVTPVNHYGIARIRGDAMKRASSSMGALVDLWKNETDGISMTEVKHIEIMSFRNGTGVLGTINSAVASTSITLLQAADAVNIDLGARLGAVSSATSLSPTVRSGFAKVTGINRVTGVLTFGANLDTLITGVTATDSFVRAGDAAVGGVPTVLSGAALWIDGTGGALFGLTRSTDPVRLAGQAPDLTGINMEDAIIEAEAKLVVQGFATDDLVMHCNPLDIKELKKTIGGKVTYPRTEMKTTIAGISFRAYEFEGDNGTIKMISNPFYPKGEFLMADMSECSLDSMGPAPHLQDYDTNKFLRTGTDDTWQVAFATYGQMIYKMPVKFLRGLNWGA
jgi:hypothetical protein